MRVEMYEGFITFDIETSGATIHGRKGGDGPPLLLLHGYPQNHLIWHCIANQLAEHFTVVAADLRGYGDSTKPKTDDTHAPYSKRAMAQDQVDVMTTLGFDSFMVAGHDRGGRVGHRMALDHPNRVEKLSVLDIVPTHKLYHNVTREFATGYYHWFFLIQPFDLPEKLIGNDPEYYLLRKTGNLGGADKFNPDALAEYIRCFSDPRTIHASCEDYRAAASIDLEHDEADLSVKLACPVQALWGEFGQMHGQFDVLETWRERALDVSGKALPCGHFLPEECPEETLQEFLNFFAK